jgi:hypothetical protein
MSQTATPEIDPRCEIDLDPAATDVETESSVAATDGGFVCTSCGAANKKNSMEVCRHCGFYARLNTFVELQSWDREEEPGEEEEQAPSHWEVWKETLPKFMPVWAMVIGACVAAVVAESVAVRFLTPEEGPVRMLWSLGQLGVGIMAVGLMHTFVYVRVIMDDDNFKMLDVLVRPIGCWMPTFRRLPATTKQVAVAASGVTMIAMSLLVIGAIPYDRLWDWGINAREDSTNLMQAIVQQAKKGQGKDQSLEEAMRDFTEGKEEKKPAAAKPLISVQCVIVGYTPDGDTGDFRSLVLASVVDGELKLVGSVSQGISPEARAVLSKRLGKLARSTPFVPTRIEANWLEPLMACMVQCEQQTASGQLVAPRFEKLLDDLSF